MSNAISLKYSFLERYTDVRPVAIMGAPDAHHVFLTVGDKRFCVTPYGCETKERAEQIRETLVAALETIIKKESRR